MKQHQIHYVLMVWALAAMTLAGCTMDDEITEIVQQEQTQQQQPNSVVEALKAVPGVSNVEMQVNSLSAQDTVYFFTFTQPKNHYQPEGETFNQRACLRFKGFDSDVVLLTHGYMMGVKPEQVYYPDVANYLQANCVAVEHRYFGASLPEPPDDMNYTYLNADQQSRDLHAIVQALKTHLFKTGKWVSTGTSKDGITTTLLAYHSDLYNWQDIDVFVPFCAPFLVGTTNTDGSHLCLDEQPGRYLETVCGSDYPAGTAEHTAYQRLHTIANYICTQPTVRDACIKAIFASAPDDYKKVLGQYNSHSTMSTGDLTKDLTAVAYRYFVDNLFGKFSYINYSRWANYVPDPVLALTDGKELQNVVEFIFQNQTELEKFLESKEEEQAAGNGSPRRAYGDDYGYGYDYETVPNYEAYWAYLQMLREDLGAPYYVQAYKELGEAANGYTLVDGTYLTTSQARDVNYMFTNCCLFSGLYEQDNGRLMSDVRQWLYTETSAPIIFVYARNDPWTAGAPDDAAFAQNADHLVKVVDMIATHNDAFMNRNIFEKSSEDAIIAALNRFLKINL